MRRLPAERAQARNVLARIELFASQIARDASAPAAARLAHGISEAVAELDRLLPPDVAGPSHAASARGGADVAELLGQLARRIGAALAARGIDLWLATGGAPRVASDPHLVRRAALLLVRGGAEALTGGGEIVLGVASGRRRAGITVSLHGVGSTPIGDACADEAERFALRARGSLERGASGASALLWLPGEGVRWAAS